MPGGTHLRCVMRDKRSHQAAIGAHTAASRARKARVPGVGTAAVRGQGGAAKEVAAAAACQAG